MIIKVTEEMSRSEAERKGHRKPRWGLGEPDILSRVSDEKTPKKGERSACGTEVRCAWNLVCREDIAQGRAYICTMMHLLEEKNERAEMRAAEMLMIDYNKSHPMSSYYSVSATLPSDLLTILLWPSNNKAKWDELTLLFRDGNRLRLRSLSQVINPVTDKVIDETLFLNLN